MLKNLRKELTSLGAKVKLRKSGLGLLSRAKEVKRGMGGERVMTVREKRICDVIKSCWRCKKSQNAELNSSVSEINDKDTETASINVAMAFF